MITLRVMTHSKRLFEGETRAVTLPAVAGRMQVLPRHIPFVALLETGVIAADRERTERFECAVSSGIAYLVNDELTVFADAAETLEMIDIERAHAAIAEAKMLMRQHPDGSILHRTAEKYLRRAQNRLHFVRARKGKDL